MLIGYGRVGRLIAHDLLASRPFILIEDQPDMARDAKAEGLDVVRGNAVDPEALKAAGIERAAKLLIAIPEGFEAGAIIEAARAINPASPSSPARIRTPRSSISRAKARTKS